MEKKNIIIIALIIIILGGVGYYEYRAIKSVGGDKDVSTIENTESKEVVLDINDPVVQELYDDFMDVSPSTHYLAMKPLYEQILEDKKVTLSNIDMNTKYLMAIENIELKDALCSKYASDYHSYDGYICGWNQSGEFDGNISTKDFSKQVLKEEIEKMFGPGSYAFVQSVHFWPGHYYRYDEKSDNYYFACCPSCGGTGGRDWRPTISSAIKKDDKIIIDTNVKEYILLSNDVIDEFNVKYTFKYSEQTDSYYFVSAEKID